MENIYQTFLVVKFDENKLQCPYLSHIKIFNCISFFKGMLIDFSFKQGTEAKTLSFEKKYHKAMERVYY